MHTPQVSSRLYHAALCLIGLVCGCGIYTFSGSTLPGHLETVDIPLFVNKSLQPEVAEELTEQLNNRILRSNLLSVAASRGDATISGAVLSYANNPYTYGAEGYRDVNVSQYAVSISVSIEFVDNKKDEPIYTGTVRGEGVYDFERETEEIGRRRAMEQIVDQIMQNSVQSW
jgi:hypothetical protein